MSTLKRTREDDEAAACEAGGAGGAPPPPPPPARRRPTTHSVVAAEAYERRPKLTDVIGLVAKNGYAREANGFAGLCNPKLVRRHPRASRRRAVRPRH